MINIAVCDDDFKDRKEVVNKVSRFQKENDIIIEISEYENGNQLLKEYAWQYDIVILDIELDHIYGVDVARKIREMDEEIQILFVTNYKEYAYESFSVNPEGYIQKSTGYDVFSEIFRKMLNRLEARREKFIFAYDGSITTVSIGKIEYLKYFDREVVARLCDGSYEKTRETLKNVLENDHKKMFLQISRDVAVNLLWIQECRKGYVRMKASQRSFKISVRRKKYVEDTYLKYLRDRVIENWK